MSTSSVFAQPQCFTGHKGSVLDITSFENDSSTIVTSSEDKTLRLWDLRTGKTRQCITGFGADPVNIVKYAPNDPHQLFGMTDDAIVTFDLRREGLLVRDSHSTLYSHTQPTTTPNDMEEVCELSSFAVHPKESLHLLAVGDDEGTVTVVNSKSGEVTKRLSRTHSNVIGAVTFQPNSHNYLCSGGFDSLFCCWDCSRGRVCGEVINFSQRQPEQEQQMANPPFVHDLLYREGGRQVVVALGDGSLRLLRYVQKQGFVSVGKMLAAHGGMATSVCDFSLVFPRPDTETETMRGTGTGTETETSVERESNCVISAGIDCFIRGWRITSNTAITSGGDSTVQAQTHSATSLLSASSNNKKKKTKTKNKQQLSSISPSGPSPGPLATASAYTFDPMFSIDHKDKINAIAFVEGWAWDRDERREAAVPMPIGGGGDVSDEDSRATTTAAAGGAGERGRGAEEGPSRGWTAGGVAVADVTPAWKLYQLQG